MRIFLDRDCVWVLEDSGPFVEEKTLHWVDSRDKGLTLAYLRVICALIRRGSVAGNTVANLTGAIRAKGLDGTEYARFSPLAKVLVAHPCQ